MSDTAYSGQRAYKDMTDEELQGFVVGGYKGAVSAVNAIPASEEIRRRLQLAAAGFEIREKNDDQ